MISYTKLRDGSWGVRSTSKIIDGQLITVTKKDGQTKIETVHKVLWTGNGVWLASVLQTQSRDESASSPAYGRGRGKRSAGRSCDYCGSRSCPRAFNPNDLCNED